MSENASPPTPDEQPTAPLVPVTPEPAVQGSPAPGAQPFVSAGPSTTAYPATTAAPPTGRVPTRSRIPGWAVAASIVGGLALVGIGFVGGLGTGLLVSHREGAVVERAGQGGPMMDRFGMGRAGDSWGQDRRQGSGRDQGAVPGGGTGGSTQGATPQP